MKNKLQCMTAILFLMLSTAAFAVDPLAASLKPEITDLFGAGSTIAYCIYVGEIVVGSVAYIKSKNLMLLLGVPILMLFTHAMFSYVSG
jgi:type IV conjugative transfer system pilin TraA